MDANHFAEVANSEGIKLQRFLLNDTSYLMISKNAQVAQLNENTAKSVCMLWMHKWFYLHYFRSVALIISEMLAIWTGMM